MTPSSPARLQSVRDQPTDQNFRRLAQEAAEVGNRVESIEEEGVAPSGAAGGVLKGTYPNPSFATPQATKAELENEASLRTSADSTEATARASADSTEASTRAAADTAEETARKAADATEKTARESGDTAVKGEVATEKTARESADATEVTNRKAEVKTEKEAREAADALRELLANKDTTGTLGTSDTKYPSQKAVKTYVDAGDSTEKTARESAITAEASTRSSADATLTAADATEKTNREAADAAEKAARLLAEEDFVVGPEGAVDNDIAVFDGTTGKLIKDGAKTIAQVLAQAEEAARVLANAAAAGLSVKNPLSYASTSAFTVTASTALTLEGDCPFVIDGATAPAVATRLLLKNQASEAQNGIYEVTKMECLGGEGVLGGEGELGVGSKWKLTRTSDADSTEEVRQGMFVLVTKGAVNTSTTWILTTENPITVGTTAQTFAAFTAAPTGAAGGVLTGTYPSPTSTASGFGVVYHGTEAEKARPEGWAQVFWIGTVEPKKAAAHDPWLNPEDVSTQFRDYGLVTSLPTSPTPEAGDRCSFYADKTNGVIWDLIYTGEGTYPWSKIGGPPLRAKDAGGERTTESETFQTTGAPTITAPLKMEFAANYGVRLGLMNPAGQMELGLFANAVEKDALTWVQPIGQGAPGANDAGPYTVAAGQAIALRYRRRFSGKAFFLQMFLEIDPIRVG